MPDQLPPSAPPPAPPGFPPGCGLIFCLAGFGAAVVMAGYIFGHAGRWMPPPWAFPLILAFLVTMTWTVWGALVLDALIFEPPPEAFWTILLRFAALALLQWGWMYGIGRSLKRLYGNGWMGRVIALWAALSVVSGIAYWASMAALGVAGSGALFGVVGLAAVGVALALRRMAACDATRREEPSERDADEERVRPS